MNTLDNGSGRFALCDGNNIPFSFEVLLNKPYMDGNGGESHALIKMMGDPGHESLVSLELGSCHKFGMVSSRSFTDSKFWTCQSSICNWFSIYDQFNETVLVLWIAVSQLSIGNGIFAVLAMLITSWAGIVCHRTRCRLPLLQTSAPL